MIDSKQLEALAAVITEQSFDKAARVLFLTQSAVSQRIRQLEERIGRMLVVRSSPVRPTPAGMALLRHYRQLAMLEQDLFDEIGPGENRGLETVKLAVNADSLDTWFLRGVRNILAEGGVLLELVVDDQSVTHAYLRSGEVQGAITSTPANFQGLLTHDLGDMEYLCVATPNFRDRYCRHGFDLEAAKHAPMVIFSRKDALQHEFLQQRFGEAISPPVHVMPSNISFQGLILEGLAYGMVSRILAEPHVQRGELVDLAPGETLRVPHFYQCWSLQSGLSRRMAEAVVATARAFLTARIHPRERNTPREAGPHRSPRPETGPLRSRE
jgi:LysR family transcriptional regulator (chromosome initiation inhibitor)